MDLDMLKLFLEKFNVNGDVIHDFLLDKKIIEINGNSFLVDNKYSLIKNEVYSGVLLFINLSLNLPSTFLLNFIKDNSKNIIEAKSEKQALEFTYSKSLSFSSIINKYQLRFKEDEFYLMEFEGNILGYFKYDIKNKTHPLKNMMNIGEYLHE